MTATQAPRPEMSDPAFTSAWYDTATDGDLSRVAAILEADALGIEMCLDNGLHRALRDAIETA